VNEAVIGLIGAVVGGTLTSGTTLLAEWQRIRTSRTDRRSDEFKRYVQAGRLVEEELSDSVNILYNALETREWWPRGTTLPVDRWDQLSVRQPR
jgi:hypothetical protein